MGFTRLLSTAFISSLVLSSGLAIADVKVDPTLTVKPKAKIKTQHNTGVSYRYVGVRYMSQSLDFGAVDCTQDGLVLDGSLPIRDGWFAVGSFGDVNGNPCGSSNVSVGGGYHTPFNNQFDMFGTLRFETISPDSGGSDSGLILTGGLRGFVSREVEVKAELMHSTTYDGTTSVGVGGLYWFNPSVSGTLDLSLSSDSTTIAVGARFNF